MNKEQIKRLPFVVKIYQLIFPSESHCGICELPWSICDHKFIMINETDSIFYVCPYCWQHSSLSEILEATMKGYTDQLWESIRIRSKKEFLSSYKIDDILDKIKAEYIATHK